jgi:signal transduction histidine kinase
LDSTLKRAKRNLERILNIQYEVEDIIGNRDYRAYHLLSFLLEECTDELEALTAEQLGEGEVINRLRGKIDDIFGPKTSEIKEVNPDEFLRDKLDQLRRQFTHREIEFINKIDKTAAIHLPEDVFDKIITGLIRNAVENTPDGGKVELGVRSGNTGTELVIKDYGVGITEESRRRIFEGFFTTRETMDYSSKRPFDFNAGGKGADLLRMKIFSERYNFKIDMESSRCRYIPAEKDICPGDISSCGFCKQKGDCHQSGGTTFRLFFPHLPSNPGKTD